MAQSRFKWIEKHSVFTFVLAATALKAFSRNFQRGGDLTAHIPIDKWKIIILKSSLYLWVQVSNLFMAPVLAVCSKKGRWQSCVRCWELGPSPRAKRWLRKFWRPLTGWGMDQVFKKSPPPPFNTDLWIDTYHFKSDPPSWTVTVPLSFQNIGLEDIKVSKTIGYAYDDFFSFHSFWWLIRLNNFLHRISNK